jgi:hypothetical protein
MSAAGKDVETLSSTIENTELDKNPIKVSLLSKLLTLSATIICVGFIAFGFYTLIFLSNYISSHSNGALPIGLAFIIVGVALFGYLKRHTEIIFKSRAYELHNQNKYRARFEHKAIHNLIFELRSRSAYLRFMGNVILIILVMVLGVGYTLFQGAERVAGLSVNDTQLLLNQQRIVERDISNLKSNRDSIVSNLNDQKVTADVLERTTVLYSTIDERILRLEESSVSIAKRIAEPESGTKASSETDQPFANYALSLLSTKIGAVMLLVFGAQILVSLYRYLIRLAAFSDSRADTMMLIHENELSFEKLADFLNPDQIEFTTKAEAPSTQALKIAKDFITLSNDQIIKATEKKP